VATGLDSTRNEQVERVKTSVCCINSDGSSTNVTFLSSQKILFLMQTSAKFYQVCALKFASFSLSTKLFRIICRSCKYFYHLPLYQTFIAFCLFV